MAEPTPASASLTSAYSERESRRAVAAAGVGNALEFYDFVTFTFFAIQIGETFFPSKDAYVSLMASLATFGAGFIARPVGAWYLGRLSDRTGRRSVMLLSMALMGLGTAILVFTPGYASIGIAAPVLAVIARLVQGFALGGEVGAASSYMIEAAAPQRRGQASSWQQVSQAIAGLVGAAIGLLVSLMLTPHDLASFGWRIALGAGLAIVPFALLIRRSIPETHGHAAAPVLTPPADASYRRTCVVGFLLIGMSTIATYAFNYQASYVQSKLMFSPSVALAGQAAGYALGIVAGLGGGMLSDRIGRKPLILGSRLLYAALIVPLLTLQLAVRDPAVTIMTSALLILPNALGSGAVYAAIAESLPQHVRASSFALIYSLPGTILGGTTQLVLEWLIHVTGNRLSIAWYLMAVALLSCTAAFFRPRARRCGSAERCGSRPPDLARGASPTHLRAMTQRQPALFLGHGSPMTAITDNPARRSFAALGRALDDADARPRAILCISAHWETRGRIHLTAGERPRTIHDFRGFPDELYAIRYPAPGAAWLVDRAAALLGPEGVVADPAWGFDHGTWGVLQPMFPEADVPVVAMSLDRGLTPRAHLSAAAALAPLRDEGVLIVASGNVIHNLAEWRATQGTVPGWADDFRNRVNAAMLAGDTAALTGFAPSDDAASRAINSGEHYLPLLYAAGARLRGDDVMVFNDTVDGALSMTSYFIGNPALVSPPAVELAQ